MIDLRCGDCIIKMREMEDNSVDLILTDPPYELGFMGKKWDGTGIAFNKTMWKEAFRVLKPGGYLMAFSGTRTYHRMVVAIEDVGFEVKDMINYMYGSGFPKSLDISKNLDKKLGVERKILGRNPNSRENCNKTNTLYESGTVGKTDYITAPASDIAKIYEGYKTQLKPSHEPICLAMKPLSEKNFADNIMKWGTGGLNIDESRIGTDSITIKGNNNVNMFNGFEDKGALNEVREGRYPANTIISEDIAPILDEQSKGGASRFFYNAKIEEEDYIPFYYTSKCSKKERNSDINGELISGEAKGGVGKGMNNSNIRPDGSKRKEVLNVNNHPTVKPKSILKYLLKLGLPPYDSVVLDMFAGSGSLGLAINDINKETGRNHKAILIEMEEEHCEIIKKRCNLEE